MGPHDHQLAEGTLPAAYKPQGYKHGAVHLTLSVGTHPVRKVECVKMDYITPNGTPAACYGMGDGKGNHPAHDPIPVWITQQESLIWESETEPFIVYLMKHGPDGKKVVWSENTPFYRPFPARSIEGTYYDPGTKETRKIHRVSSGPAREEWIGVRPEIHFAVSFLGPNWNVEKLDPHATTLP
jgi:hypothetical protein